VLGVCVASVLALLGADGRVGAQEGQGVFITQASLRLIKLVEAANRDGYVLNENTFSIGGGMLKQSKTEWIKLFEVPLTAGKDYRFLAAGDADARDVDLQVVDAAGKVVAADAAADPEALVNFRPTASGRYIISIRLYASRENLECVCMGVVMFKK